MNSEPVREKNKKSRRVYTESELDVLLRQVRSPSTKEAFKALIGLIQRYFVSTNKQLEKRESPAFPEQIVYMGKNINNE